MLPGVPLALAGRDHGDLVGAAASVLALQLDSLGARFVVDAPPVLNASALSAPQPAALGRADPVGQQLRGETLACTHKLFDGFDAGAVAVRDVLGGSQLSAADLAFVAPVVRSSSAAGPGSVKQSHVYLRTRGSAAAAVGELQLLCGVVIEGQAAPEQRAQEEQRVVSAQAHVGHRER